MMKVLLDHTINSIARRMRELAILLSLIYSIKKIQLELKTLHFESKTIQLGNQQRLLYL